jgi:hypothetical protein
VWGHGALLLHGGEPLSHALLDGLDHVSHAMCGEPSARILNAQEMLVGSNFLPLTIFIMVSGMHKWW